MYHQAVFGISPSDLPALKSLTDVNLNTVSGANHTCRIDGMSNYPFMNDSDKCSKLNRGRKFYALLAHRHLDGSNVSQLEAEFSEDGVKIAPYVLASVNKYYWEEVKDCISILFELARDWKTPEIYQFNQS